MERIENYLKKKKGKSEESFSFFLFASSSFVPSQFGIYFLQYYLFDLFVCLFLLILWIIYRWMNLSIERYYLKNVQTNTTLVKFFFSYFCCSFHIIYLLFDKWKQHLDLLQDEIDLLMKLTWNCLVIHLYMFKTKDTTKIHFFNIEKTITLISSAFDLCCKDCSLC